MHGLTEKHDTPHYGFMAASDIVIKGAWAGPASLKLSPHALAPIAGLPVREIVSATHIVADLTLGLGRVAYDYLNN